MKKLNIDTKQLPVKSVMSAISRAKDNLMTAADFSKETGNDFKLKQIARIYEMYSARLLESNLLDFDDIIMQTVFMLRFNDEIRRKLQNRFRYVLVDEFQDTNVAQLELTMLYRADTTTSWSSEMTIRAYTSSAVRRLKTFFRSIGNTKMSPLSVWSRTTARQKTFSMRQMRSSRKTKDVTQKSLVRRRKRRRNFPCPASESA